MTITATICHSNGIIEEHYENNTKKWFKYLNGEKVLHNENGPALISVEGSQWYQNGKKHRVGGPAMEEPGGDKLWYQHGKLHREDGPAIEWAAGSREWWTNGLRHHGDGPAITDPDGEQHWYKNDKKHRIDGPASIYSNGYMQWWIDGLEITESQFNNIHLNKELHKELPNMNIQHKKVKI